MIKNRPNLYNFLLIIFFAVLLFSCGNNDDDDDSSGGGGSASEANQKKKFVYDKLHGSYLWYKHVKSADYAAFDSPEKLLNALKYPALDKWSYITTTTGYTQYFEEGVYIGYGFSIKRNNDGVYIRFTYPGAPAAGKLKRGQRFLEINGKTVKEIDDQGLWGSIYKEDKVGVESTFKVLEGAVEKTITLKKAKVKIVTVLADTVLELQNKKIGYLAFKGFIEPSRLELKNAFAKFKQANVGEMVLDLRYNGGGRLHVAEYLASLIAIGSKVKAGDVFENLIHNDKYSRWDSSINYSSVQNGLALDRVYVLTTSSTCSASESVISGLRAFIDVHTVGGTTCGKPVGMYGWRYLDLHLSMIEFEGVNSKGEGKYFSGIPADCPAQDDLSNDLGDASEDMLSEALHLMNTGNCSPVKTTASLRATIPDSIEPTEIYTGFRREVGAF